MHSLLKRFKRSDYLKTFEQKISGTINNGYKIIPKSSQNNPKIIPKSSQKFPKKSKKKIQKNPVLENEENEKKYFVNFVEKNIKLKMDYTNILKI